MRDGVVIGAPGEDIGTIGDAGSVTYSRNAGNWFSLLLEDTGAADLPADAAFGESLASVNG